MNELIKLIEEAKQKDLYISVVVHNDKNLGRSPTRISMPINGANVKNSLETLSRAIDNF
ncbi:hypothetical protein [Entomomonas moraniae]|uniref:hypothetical protein n=1 Tax=Entomomonas moraniae TaxID=2213226 RepID=UPI0013DFC351|nr:hypothetical protein [Entomomonas moraniae]